MIRAATVLATLTILTPFSHAYILIDDFTVGDYHRVLEWPNSGDSHQKFNLDQNHALFGERQSVLDIRSNEGRVPISLDIGSGEAKVSASHYFFFEWRLNFGLDNQPLVDMGQETEIWIDYHTENPSGLLPDRFTLSVNSAGSGSSTATGFLTRPGGVKFTRQAFNGDVDWTRVRSFQFTQLWDTLPNPLTYSLTKIYAVPEPSSILILAVGGGLLARRQRPRVWSSSSLP